MLPKKKTKTQPFTALAGWLEREKSVKSISMKDAKTQIITAVIAALATILAAWIGKCNFSTPPEKESGQPFENTAQVIPNQQNQAEKVENNQKKEITVQGDYVEGDKLETRPKETRQTKPVSQKQAIDSSKNEASRKYENSGPGTQINIEEMKAPLTLNTIESPPPIFKLINFEKNEGHFVGGLLHNQEGTEFKFKIRVEFSYYSKQGKNELAVAFNRETKYHITVGYKEGSFKSFIGRSAGDREGNTRVCYMQNPVNGIYEVEILSNDDISNPLDFLIFGVDRDVVYKITR